MTTYAEALLALADELRDLAALPPERAMVVLAPLVDRTSPESAEKRLALARRLAAQIAVDEAGSQAALARQLGLGTGAISRIVTGHRSR